MEKFYWLGRKRSAIAMARLATTAEARLIHYDLAGRYSIKAAYCPSFMVPKKGPATEGERAALHIPLPAAPSQDRGVNPGIRRDPETPKGGSR